MFPDHSGSTVSPHMWGIEGYPRGGPHKRVAQESKSVEITRHVCSIIDQLRTKRTAEGWRRLAHRTLAHIGKPSCGENLSTRTRLLTYIQTPGAGSWVLTHPRTVDPCRDAQTVVTWYRRSIMPAHITRRQLQQAC